MQELTTAGHEFQNMVLYILDATVLVSRHLSVSSAIYYSLQRITREVGESLYTPAGVVGIPNLRKVDRRRSIIAIRLQDHVILGMGQRVDLQIRSSFVILS